MNPFLEQWVTMISPEINEKEWRGIEKEGWCGRMWTWGCPMKIRI
jgi:hypothetical protein